MRHIRDNVYEVSREEMIKLYNDKQAMFNIRVLHKDTLFEQMKEMELEAKKKNNEICYVRQNGELFRRFGNEEKNKDWFIITYKEFANDLDGSIIWK